MDAIKQLEAELQVLDAPRKPVSEKKPVAPVVVLADRVPPVEEHASKKLYAAKTLADALDNLSEYVEQARAAAHGLVDAFSPIESAGHPLTVGEDLTTPKETDDDEVPQES